MNYKPDKNTLIDFLYGELEEGERLKVEAYLDQHPEAKQELDGLDFGRSLMQHIKDKKVIPPAIFIEEKNSVSISNQRIFNPGLQRFLIRSAAVFLLIFTFVYLTNARISFKNQELKIGFGKEIEANTPESVKNENQLGIREIAKKEAEISNEKLGKVFQHKLENNQDSIFNQFTQLERQLDNLQKQINAKNNLAQNHLNQKEITSLIEQIKKENLKMMVQIAELSGQQQQEYTEKLLSAFAGYLEKQRVQDLEAIGVSINTVQQKTEKKQEFTDKLLSQIIKTVNHNSNE